MTTPGELILLFVNKEEGWIKAFPGEHFFNLEIIYEQQYCYTQQWIARNRLFAPIRFGFQHKTSE